MSSVIDMNERPTHGGGYDREGRPNNNERIREHGIKLYVVNTNKFHHVIVAINIFSSLRRLEPRIFAYLKYYTLCDPGRIAKLNYNLTSNKRGNKII